MTKAHPRVMFYVQHLLGIGHLARASHVVDALVAAGAPVCMVTGGRPVAGFPGPGVQHVALPTIASGDAGFSGLVNDAGDPVDDVFRNRRRDLLLAAFRDFRPDVVITEAFPFGRRQVRFELLPLIDAIEATVPRPKLMASVRDILQARKPQRDRETVDLISAHYDRVLVHGDPSFIRLEDTFPMAAGITEKVRYTGLVAPPRPAPSSERFDVVVSAGGGAVGAALIDAARGAADLLPDVARWCIVTGPNLPDVDFARLQARARPGVELHRFRTDFASLLAAARLSVSQAGYNTVCDILRAECRAILIPFASGGETEQTTRATRLAAMGRASVVTETDLSPSVMARAIAAALAAPAPGPATDLDLDGAAGTTQLLLSGGI